MATQQPSQGILGVDGDCSSGAAGVRDHGGGAVAVDLKSADWLVANLEHDPPGKPFKSGRPTAHIPPVHVADCPDRGRALSAKRRMTETVQPAAPAPAMLMRRAGTAVRLRRARNAARSLTTTSVSPKISHHGRPRHRG